MIFRRFSLALIIISLGILPIMGQTDQPPTITSENARALAPIQTMTFAEDQIIINVALHPNNQYLYITYWQNEYTYLKLWDMVSNQEITSIQIADNIYTNSVGLGGHNNEIVVISGQNLRFLAYDTLEEIKVLSIGAPDPLALSEDETRIIYAYSMGFGLIDTISETRIMTRDFNEYAYAISWSADFSLVASSFLNTIKIWDVEQNTVIYEHPTQLIGNVAFHPDGETIIIYEDTTLELFDLTTQTTLSTITNTSNAMFISVGKFSPDGTLFAINDTDGVIHLYDISQKTFTEITQLPVGNGLSFMRDFNSQFIISQNDNELIVWGLQGDAETGLVSLENTVIGTVNESITAQPFNNPQGQCTIQTGETVLAIGISRDESILVYASGAGCEGANWILPASTNVNNRVTWADNVLQLRQFVHTQPPQHGITIPVNDAESVCDDIRGTANLPNHEPPYLTYPYRMPTAVEAIVDLFYVYGPTQNNPVELILCSSFNDVVYETCYYSNNTTFTRIRRDITMQLVDYQTHGLVASQTFRGNEPDYCASTQTLIDARGGNYEILGQPIDDSTTWVPWALDIITNGIGGNRRTVVNSDGINVRNEPNTSAEILTRLAYNTPLNVMGKNEAGDWLAVLLPDMSKGWVSVSLIQLADSIDIATLPVLEPVPADQLPILLP